LTEAGREAFLKYDTSKKSVLPVITSGST
jgi:hypothetical protein